MQAETPETSRPQQQGQRSDPAALPQRSASLGDRAAAPRRAAPGLKPPPLPTAVFTSGASKHSFVFQSHPQKRKRALKSSDDTAFTG